MPEINWNHAFAFLVLGFLLGNRSAWDLAGALASWLEGLGTPIDPSELPPHVRAEVQDLDEWEPRD